MVFNRETLLEQINQGMRTKDLASFYGVTVRTIQRKLSEHNISLRAVSYTAITHQQLTDEVRNILSEGNNLGEILIDGRLKAIGITVQRHRIRRSLREVVPEPQRALRRISRRKYYCRAPLSVVHIDGYHKLIRWRFVIHGAIDGFSRKLFFLGVANNNRASTVLKLFKKAVYKCGLPSRIRIDKGRENVGIADYMLRRRGPCRSSVLAGRSVHNQRIERHWLDCKNGCVLAYRKRFQAMENAGMLDYKDERDIYSLHLCFMPLLKKSLKMFWRSWGLHKHRSLKHKCPDFVFERGLHDLRMFSMRRKLKFTELDQRNWESQDEQYEEDENKWNNIEGLHTPRIRCPLNPRQDDILRQYVGRLHITWKNVIDVYLKIRQLVLNNSS